MPWVRNRNTGETRWIDDAPSTGGQAPAHRPAIVPIGQGNPRLPAQVQGDVLGNQRTQQQIEQDNERQRIFLEEADRNRRAWEASHNPDGSEKPDTGKPTEYQAKSAGFLGRMLESENNYIAVPEGSRDPRAYLGQVLHDWGMGIENTLPTYLGGNSPERQRADQAARNFISASLRQESGAAINNTEFDRQYQIFYPQPGDSPEVLRQKDAARQQAINGFRIAAGPLATQATAGKTPPGGSLGAFIGGLAKQAQSGAQQRQPARAPARPVIQNAPRRASGNVIRYDRNGNMIR